MFFDKEIGYKLIKTNFTGFPKMIKVEQRFSDEHITDIDGAVREEIAKLPLPELRGKRVAVTAGSRGIPNFMECCRAIGRELRARAHSPSSFRRWAVTAAVPRRDR